MASQTEGKSHKTQLTMSRVPKRFWNEHPTLSSLLLTMTWCSGNFVTHALLVKDTADGHLKQEGSRRSRAKSTNLACPTNNRTLWHPVQQQAPPLQTAGLCMSTYRCTFCLCFACSLLCLPFTLCACMYAEATCVINACLTIVCLPFQVGRRRRCLA